MVIFLVLNLYCAGNRYSLVTNGGLMPEGVITGTLHSIKAAYFKHIKAFEMCVSIYLFIYFRVMEKDPVHANCLPVHIGTLVELNKANGKKHNI